MLNRKRLSKTTSTAQGNVALFDLATTSHWHAIAVAATQAAAGLNCSRNCLIRLFLCKSKLAVSASLVIFQQPRALPRSVRICSHLIHPHALPSTAIYVGSSRLFPEPHRGRVHEFKHWSSSCRRTQPAASDHVQVACSRHRLQCLSPQRSVWSRPDAAGSPRPPRPCTRHNRMQPHH
jgi:hypothetical protein